jgi:hypothetical protein
MSKTNVKELPEYCWSVLQVTGELVMLKRGESGYIPQNPDNAPWGAENVDILNERLGVTKGMAEAMKNGSMFGFHTPSSNPNNFDDEGKWIK